MYFSLSIFLKSHLIYCCLFSVVIFVKHTELSLCVNCAVWITLLACKEGSSLPVSSIWVHGNFSDTKICFCVHFYSLVILINTFCCHMQRMYSLFYFNNFSIVPFVHNGIINYIISAFVGVLGRIILGELHCCEMHNRNSHSNTLNLG